jgi:hypothetical protein
MTFWEWLHKLGPGWPTERQWAVLMTWGLAVGMLVMTIDRPELWREELFKTLITVILITGFVNLILGFHFAANKTDEVKAQNTAKAFEAVTAVANASGASSDPNALHSGDTVQIEKDDK